MYPISDAAKALFEAEQRQVLLITGRDRNGTSIRITQENVMQDGFNIDRYSCNGQKLEIGTAIAAEMTLKLDNRQGQFDGVIFEGTELFVEIGIADWSQSDPTYYWIPCGYFTPCEQPRALSVIQINALDRMMKLDATLPLLKPWTDNNGNAITNNAGNPISFAVQLSLPCTVATLVQQICNGCGITLGGSINALPNANYELDALPNLQNKLTCRTLIQWCAGIMGVNAWIDWNGQLRFSWYGGSAAHTLTTANRFKSDLNENDIAITGVQYTNTNGITLLAGSADYAIDMTGNFLAAGGMAEILPNVKNAIAGFTYRPFTASVINAPYLWPMDMIAFVKDGTSHTCAVTNVNFGINSTTELAGRGETAQTNLGTPPSGLTNEQSFFVESAAEITRNLDESLDQEGIFNRLTDGGEIQGLLLYNGKLYLNASYINTGTLSANFIKGGTLTLGGNNNVSGTLTVKDANGNTVGAWDKDGINVSAGSITGGSINGADLTLGGNNNVSGTLTVKDANGNTIGTWDKDGINVSAGSINGADMTLGGNNNISGSISVLNPVGNNSIKINSEGFISYSISYDIKIYDRFIEIVNHDSSRTSARIYGYIGTDENVGMVFSGSVINFDVPNGSMKYMRINADEVYMMKDLRLSGSNLTLSNGGSLSVSGTKSRTVSTDQYSNRLLYCYETPSPMFGDIGEGVISDDGLCYIWLDPIFAQTITTDQYQVFLQRYGDGECWVRERRGGCFIVQGTPGLAFGWEVKAKQRDYDQLRLEKNEARFAVPDQTYGDDAAKHIQDIQKERTIA